MILLPDRAHAGRGELGSQFGVSVLCGIGFTMSLFIANLAFAEGAPELAVKAVVGVLAGSFVAAMSGYVVLVVSLPGRAESAAEPRKA